MPDDISDGLPCDEQLAEVKRRLAAASSDLDARQTPRERFEKGTQDSAAEAEVQPMVAAMFADAPADFRYELECRSRICRINTHVGAADYDWVEAIQAPEYHDRWSSRSFKGDEAYLELRAAP